MTKTSGILGAELFILYMISWLIYSAPFSYDPDGVWLGIESLDRSNDANYVAISSFAGADTASSFILLRTWICCASLLFCALNLWRFESFFQLFSRAFGSAAKAALGALLCAVMIGSSLLTLAFDHDALFVNKDARFFGSVRDGLWWGTLPLDGFILALCVPSFAAFAMLVLVKMTEPQA